MKHVWRELVCGFYSCVMCDSAPSLCVYYLDMSAAAAALSSPHPTRAGLITHIRFVFRTRRAHMSGTYTHTPSPSCYLLSRVVAASPRRRYMYVCTCFCVYSFPSK